MKILLDSHVLLWWLSSENLGSKTKQLISSAENETSYATLSLMELAIKRRAGRMAYSFDLAKELKKESFNVDLLDEKVVWTYDEMPLPQWRDPFDHFLMAQAVARDAMLVTADAKILAFNWPLLRAWDARQ